MDFGLMPPADATYDLTILVLFKKIEMTVFRFKRNTSEINITN